MVRAATVTSLERIREHQGSSRRLETLQSQQMVRSATVTSLERKGNIWAGSAILRPCILSKWLEQQRSQV
jgi:hypothetical protein